MQELKRYWLEFDNREKLPTGLILGCGITAYNRDDVLLILKKNVFKKDSICNPILIIENVNISNLDQNHVIPNMLPSSNRGVWFPMGYNN